MAILGLESGLPFIILINPYLIIGIDEIQLGESPCLAMPIQQFANQKQRISVFNGDIIKTPITHAKAEASIRLLIEEDKYSGGGLGRLDKAVSQVDFDIGL